MPCFVCSFGGEAREEGGVAVCLLMGQEWKGGTWFRQLLATRSQFVLFLDRRRVGEGWRVPLFAIFSLADIVRRHVADPVKVPPGMF